MIGTKETASKRQALIGIVASTVLGFAALAPSAALAFGPPPLPALGPPPGLAGPPPGIGGPPPGIGGLPHPPIGAAPRPGVGPNPPRVAGQPALRGGARGVERNFQGHAAVARYGRSGAYGHARNRYYGVYVDGSYGSSYAYIDRDCYYTSRHGRRVLVCTSD